MEKPTCVSEQGASCLPNYRDTYQEKMATLIAQKNKAAGAINGEVSSDGINAMLGDDGDLQAMLIESIKKGETLKGSTEEWVAAASNRAREILSGIGKKKKPLTLKEQFIAWINNIIQSDSSKNVLIRKAGAISTIIEQGNIYGFTSMNNVLEVDPIAAFGFELDYVADGDIVAYLTSFIKVEEPQHQTSLIEIHVEENKTKKRKKGSPVDGQLAFDLFDF